MDFQDDRAWLLVAGAGVGVALMIFSNLLLLSVRATGGGTASCPATAWPKGKPVYTEADDYPEWDDKDKKGSFMKICDQLIAEVLAEMPEMYEMPRREVEWVGRMLRYNVKGGKMNRGLMVVESIKCLAKFQGKKLTPREVSRFAVLGWAIEWMQAWLLMADDIMDDSETRRGQPCWYKNKDVQKIAINDAFFVEMLVFKMLKRHFGREAYYVQLVDLFLETTFQTEVGQLLDTLCLNLEIEDFTMSRWTLIVKYKTAFYSFYCSVALAMIVFGISDQAAYDHAREILMVMGIYFQAQDDFLDCYGTPEQIGKIGTDIWDKKCGWLFCQAWHLTTPQQKKLLKENYGFGNNPAKEAKVKQLYRDLKLEDLYRTYEEDSYKQIMALRPTVIGKLPWEIFDIFLSKVYRRSK
jgi:farnesyl diphosphate synthase